MHLHMHLTPQVLKTPPPGRWESYTKTNNHSHMQVRGSGPGPSTCMQLRCPGRTRLGPWPLGSLAQMVPGPWVPGPHLQGRSMTFGENLCRLGDNLCRLGNTYVSTRRNIMSTWRNICRLGAIYVDWAKHMSTLLLGSWVTVR